MKNPFNLARRGKDTAKRAPRPTVARTARNRGILRHVVEQPFVVATGVAAFFHSTWALATLFSGEAPGTANALTFVGWIMPAALIAFALDVGQIVTAGEIRSGHHSAAKYSTFAVFAAATYYLQFLYMAHHMPLLELGAGIRTDLQHTVTVLRDLAIFLIPLLLPMSTLLYTFSHEERGDLAATSDVDNSPAGKQQRREAAHWTPVPTISASNGSGNGHSVPGQEPE